MRIAVLIAAGFLALVQPAAAEPAAQTRVVVELFTSQGCSSCPPADSYLRELTKREDLLALSLHVDYWNYIGWRDPFSSKQMTERQHAYRKHFQLRYVYTPQMVVDGTTEFAGMHQGTAEAAIAAAMNRTRLPITVIAGKDGAVTAKVPAGAHQGEPAVVWGVLYDEEKKTAVERGENAGRKIVNTNVVRIWRKIGVWQGTAAEYRVALAALGAAERDGFAVIVQKAEVGEILGAAALSLKMPMR
ncbi:MAG: DUF1223 domain-containing protein [Alphaproteobacteria bacterium]|nr:DUF1223 domain-containing protein [Alphaproteobacteria bacterium]